MKYKNMVQAIIEKVGGDKNIISVYHCATRLRFNLRDESKANTNDIKNIEGIVSVVQSAGQYQIIIGQHVGDVYKTLMSYLKLDEEDSIKSATEIKEEYKKKKISSQFIDIISGVFTPVLGMLTATGVIKGLLALLTTMGILTAESGTYQLLSIVGDCFFNFLPIFLGYTAMKKFNGNAFIGMAIGAALTYPSLSGIMAGTPLYTLFEGTIIEAPIYITFLGIPVILMNYASSVIPVIVASYFASKVEKFISEHTHSFVKSFVVPMVTLLISIPVAFLVIGPVASWASSLLGAIALSLYNLNSTIAGFLYSALIQVCVMFGVHWGFVTISVNNMSVLGFDPVTIAGLTSAFAQAGVVLIIMLKTRNKKLKSVCGPAFVSAMCGITEPAIYGVTLQYKKPFILACLASGFGGAILGFAGVKQYYYGANGIFGFLQVINPQTGFDSTVIATIIGCLVSFILACVFMWLFGFKDSKIEIKDDEKVMI
ncbi:MAG: PTS transporter subunit EIIC [Clostridium celatum]|nr:PTS transporter subunit EIIC [Clostridium celatum]